jgi:hypothetical protein
MDELLDQLRSLNGLTCGSIAEAPPLSLSLFLSLEKEDFLLFTATLSHFAI